MTYSGMSAIPPVQPIPDPWYQRKAAQLQRMSQGTSGLGDEQTDYTAPPPGQPKVAMLIAWGSVLAVGIGLFYAATQGWGAKKKPVRANRRRRSSRRRGTRRRSTRRNSRRRSTRRRSTRRRSSRYVLANTRRYKGLSAAARKRMPASSFALSGKRYPIVGPPGSSRERDRWQALQAIRYLHMGRISSKADYLKVRNAIIREYGAGFWRKYNGPSWPKVEKAKRKGMSRRRTRRTSRRKVAANRRRTRRNSRRGKTLHWGYDRSRRMWFYDATNGKRYYSKARTEGKVKRMAREAGLRTRRDDKLPEREFQQRFGMSRAEYGRKYLRRNAKKGKTAGRRTTRNKELKKLMKKARDQGWTIVHSGGGHLKWKPKDKSQPIVVSGSTPSDHRSISNLKSQLRRSGLKL
jgi:hypothetical protein